MDPNPGFEVALDVAFEKAQTHQGNANLEFEGGVCVVVLKNSRRNDEIELKNGEAKVFFYLESDRAIGSNGNVRTRWHFSVTFTDGEFTVNRRNHSPVISYKPYTRTRR